MKILKGILFTVLGIIVLLLVIALFVARDYAIEREIVINKPEAEVFEYIKHIKNQDNYSIWNMMDPNKKQTFTGTDGTVGFIYAWDGNSDVGAGEQEITKIEEGSRIEMELRFKRPMEGVGFAYMATEDAGNGATKVKWGMTGKSSYPMNLMNLMMESMMGDGLEEGLTNLKKNLESK
ncbi:SRPBCC family protein [uncultured Flavobacterium sp.]|uniref:SRPBCC family protein n=1 Tax=uncultured Flavobacterium sp. TaxID=165435 RepID=UPI0025F80586|nr:SRPBCC family protein [uncultured Flavobacterium sp.]